VSDAELLRLLDSRAESIADLLKEKRERHTALFVEVVAVETEMADLSNLLSSLSIAAKDIRNGGNRRPPREGRDE